VKEINQVLDKYGNHTNMAIDVLKNYRNTLEDPSYLDTKKYDTVSTLKWHIKTEAVLQKTTKFVDLWPILVKEMQ
jgi:hypothetical protein